MNLQDLDNLGVKYIEIIFENCESIYIPINCFKEFIYIENELFFKVINDGEIEYTESWMDIKNNPIDRIAYNDITNIYFLNENKDIINSIDTEYLFEYGEENIYQESNVINYKEVEVIISKKSYYINELKKSIKEIDKLNKYVNVLKNVLDKLGVEYCE